MDPITAPPNDLAERRRRLVAAALEIADTGGWAAASLRDVARAADLPAAEVFDLARTKSGLVDLISDHLDRAAFAEDDASADVSDRLFEAAMARLEVMEPQRTALLALLREEGPYSPLTARRLARTAGAVLEAGGVDASGRRGALRIALVAAALARVLRVWRDDEGALNRTMAELDRRLKSARQALSRLGAGF